MTQRRDFLKAAGAMTAAAGLGMPALRRAAAAEPLTFMTPFGFIPDFLEMMNMVSGGFLAQQGFAPKLLGGHGTATALQQLMSGRASFVRMSAIDEFTAASKSAPLLCVSTLYQGSSFSVISAKDKPVASARDMKGKTVGVVSVGGTTEQLLQIMLRAVGLTEADVKVQTVGNNPGVMQFVHQGRVDCVINSLEVVVALNRTKEPIVSWSTDRYAPMPGEIFVTTRELAQKRPDVVVRFLKALKASTDDMMHGDIAAIFRRADKDFDIPGMDNMAELVALTEVIMKGPWMSQGRANFMRNVPALWTKAGTELAGAGIASIGDVPSLYTNNYVDQALKA